MRTKRSNYVKEIREFIDEKRKSRQRWEHTSAPQCETRMSNLIQQRKREVKEIKMKQYNILNNQVVKQHLFFSLKGSDENQDIYNVIASYKMNGWKMGQEQGTRNCIMKNNKIDMLKTDNLKSD